MLLRIMQATEKIFGCSINSKKIAFPFFQLHDVAKVAKKKEFTQANKVSGIKQFISTW